MSGNVASSRRSSKLHDRRNRSALSRRIEKLEARRLLAGDLESTDLSQAQHTAFVDGIDDIAAVLGRHPAADAALSMLQDDDGTEVTFGEAIDLESIIRDQVANPIADALADLSVVSTEELVQRLMELENITDVTGGLNLDTGLVEVGFAFSNSFESEVHGIDWMFAEETGVNLQISDGLAVTGNFAMNVGLAFDLTRGLRTEQSLFVTELTPTFDFSISSEQVTQSATAGIVDASESNFEMTSTASVEMQLNDPDGDGRVTAAEIASLSGDLVTIVAVDNTCAVDVDVVPTLPGVTLPGLGKLQVTGSAFDSDPLVVQTVDFDAIRPLLNTSPNELMSSLLNVADWLTIWGDSTVLSAQLPHLGDLSIGDLTNPGPGLTEYFASFVNDGNDATFATINELADAMGVTFEYDPATQQMRLPIGREGIASTIDSAVQVANLDSPLSFVQSNEVFTHDVDTDVTFDLTIDLKKEDSLTTTRYGVADLVTGAQIVSPVEKLTGTGVLGTVGFDFTLGEYSTDQSWQATIVDPDTTSTNLTILKLYDGLTTPEDLINGGQLESSGESSLQIQDMTIIDSLFDVDPSASITSLSSFSSFDFASDIQTAGDGMLDAVQNLTMDDVFTAIHDAYEAVVDLVDIPKTVVETIPVKVSEIVDRGLTEAGYDGLDEIERNVRELYGDAIKLQDITEDVIGDAIDSVADVAEAVIDFTLDTTKQIVKTSVGVIGVVADTTLDITTNLVDAADHAGQTLDDAIQWSGSQSTIDATTATTIDLDIDIVPPTSITKSAENYLQPSSGLHLQVYAATPFGQSEPTISGLLGPLGLDLEDGNVVIAGNLNRPTPLIPAVIEVTLSDPSGNGYALDGESLDLGADQIKIGGRGGIEADFAVRRSGGSTPELDRLQITLPAFGLPDQIEVQGPDLSALLDSVDLYEQLSGFPGQLDRMLGNLGDVLEGDLFGLKLPVIGDILTGPANAIERLRADLAAVLEDLPSFDPEAIRDGIATAMGVAKDAIELIESTDEITWQVVTTLPIASRTIDASDIELGGRAFGASLDGDFTVSGAINMTLTMGVNTDIGVFVETDTDDIVVNLDVFATRSTNQFNLSGRLGFIEAGVFIDAVDGAAVKAGETAQIFYADYAIDLVDDDGDDRLSVFEVDDTLASLTSDLLALDADTIKGGTGTGPGDDLTFKIVTQANSETAAAMPSLRTDLTI